MAAAKRWNTDFQVPILQGILPIKTSQIPAEMVAGLTLAALAIPEVMGYTKIAGTPVITGLYTILIPGALIAVVGAIVVSWAVDLEQHVHVLGTIPSGLPHVGLPQVNWSWELIGKLVPTAFAMFVLILAQSAATSRAYAARYNESFSENTDLIGLAMANLGAGLSGTFVVNGSPTKTQMVDSAGGRSQLALIFTALMVLLVLLFLTRPLAYMPECVLSAVVFLIGVELVDLQGMRRIFVQRRSEFWVALTTTLTVLVIGVEQGILLAVVLSLIDHTRHGYRPKTVVLLPTESGAWQPQPLATGSQALPGLVVYRFTHSLYYANSQQLAEDISGLVNAANPPLRRLCIEASAIDDIDYTAAETFRSILELLKSKGIDLVMCQLANELRSNESQNLADLFSEVTLYETLSAMKIDYQCMTETPSS
jgi:MFS superfamily sulfate permease-like transporter